MVEGDTCIFGGNKCAPIFTPIYTTYDKRRNCIYIQTLVNSKSYRKVQYLEHTL